MLKDHSLFFAYHGSRNLIRWLQVQTPAAQLLVVTFFFCWRLLGLIPGATAGCDPGKIAMLQSLGLPQIFNLKERDWSQCVDPERPVQEVFFSCIAGRKDQCKRRTSLFLGRWIAWRRREGEGSKGWKVL